MPAVSKYSAKLVAKMEAWLDARIAKDEYPSIAGLGVEIDVPKSTLENWGDEKSKQYHSDVGRLLTRTRDFRESWLERHGVDGSADSKMCRVLLSAHHGVVEKTAQDLTVGQDAEKPFKVEIVVDGL